MRFQPFQSLQDALALGLSAFRPEHWAAADELSRDWRQPWMKLDEMVMDDSSEELVVTSVGGVPVCVLATARGTVGIAGLDGDSVQAPVGLEAMEGFDPSTDEVRNILASPRRFSIETDLFITVLRYRDDSRPAEHLLWRAICWLGEGRRARLRPVIEQVPQGNYPWRPVGWVKGEDTSTAPELASGATLPLVEDFPEVGFRCRLQAGPSGPFDSLERQRLEDHLTQQVGPRVMASDGRGIIASSGGGTSLFWSEVAEESPDGADPEKGERELPHPAVGLAVVPTGCGFPRGWVVAGTDKGHVIGPLDPRSDATPEVQDLASTPTVVGVLKVPQADGQDALDIIVAARDRRVTRWRWVGWDAGEAAWLRLCELLREAITDPADWTTWAQGGVRAPLSTPEGFTTPARHLAWLQLAWTDDRLRRELGQALSDGEKHPGAELGQEIGRMLRADPSPAHCGAALDLYKRAGMHLREQVDRSRPLSPDSTLGTELADRTSRNYWENADDPDWEESARAIANLATREYVHEASWRAEAAWLGTLHLGRTQEVVIVNRQGLRSLALPSGRERIGRERRRNPSPFGDLFLDQSSRGEAPTWAWARSLHLSGTRRAVVAGGDRGACQLVYVHPSGRVRVESLDGDPRMRCQTATLLAPPDDDGLRLGIVWAEGPRTWLDQMAIRYTDSGLQVSPRRHRVPIPTLLGDARKIGSQTWFVAASPTRRLTVIRVLGKLEVARSIDLDSAAVAARFADCGKEGREQPVLLAGTQGGLVWCLCAKTWTPLWMHHTGSAVTSIDVAGRGDDMRIAVASTPDLITVLDAWGRRRWRHRIGERPVDLSLVPNGEGIPDRLVVADHNGVLSVYLRPDADKWTQKAVERLRAGETAQRAIPERLRVAAMPHSSTTPYGVPLVQGPDAVRVALAEAVKNPELPQAQLDELIGLAMGEGEGGVRDPAAKHLAAMARELSRRAPIARWSALWDRARRCWSDLEPEDVAESVPPGHCELVAELLSHLRRRSDIAFDFVVERLEELAKWGPDKDGVPLRDEWVGLCAALLWAVHLPQGAEGQTEAALHHLHLLPPLAARHLRYFLEDVHQGDLCEACARAALLAERPPSGRDQTGLASALLDLGRQILATEAVGPLTSTLKAAALLATPTASKSPPTWGDALHLLRACQDLPPVTGPLLAALRQPAVGLPDDQLPLSTWTLERQTTWLTRALGRHLSMPSGQKVPGRQGHAAWSALGRVLLRQVDSGLRKVAMERLTSVVSRVRFRVSMQPTRWQGDTVALAVSLEPEGSFPVDDATFSLRQGNSGEVLYQWQGPQFDPSDPPRRVNVTARLSSRETALDIVGVTASAGRQIDRTTWRVEIRRSAPAAFRPSLLADTPALLEHLRGQVRRIDRGFAMLVVDDVLAPERVIDALRLEPGTVVIDLDGELRRHRHRRGLEGPPSAEAVLRVIAGRDPDDTTVSFNDGALPRASEGPGRVVLYPCEETVDALLSPAARQEWSKLRRLLLQHLRSGGTPALMDVLPASLADRKDQALGSAGTRWLRPHIVPSTLREHSDLVRNVAQRARSTDTEGQALINKCAGNLATLEDLLRGKQDAQLGRVKDELAGLDARDVALLVGLSRARSRLAVARLSPGMVAEETVKTTVRARGNQPKTLARAGEPLERPERVSAVQPDLLVRGLSKTDTSSLRSEDRNVLRLAGLDKATLEQLEQRGLVELRLGLWHVREDIARVVRAFERREALPPVEVLRRLIDREAWWRALRLENLQKVEDSDLKDLRGTEDSSLLPFFHDVGRLWSDRTLAPATAARLCEGLTGAPPDKGAAADGDASGRPPEPGGAATLVLRKGVGLKSPSLAGDEDDGEGGGGVAADDKDLRTRLHIVPLGVDSPAPTPDVANLYVGPGVEDLAGDVGIRIGETAMRTILKSPNPRVAFWTTVRAQTDLKLDSPFVAAGALPPGSKLFVGRKSIRSEVARHLADRSFLILGARQIGKTSLLHQLFYEAQDRRDVECLLIDAQGRDEPDVHLLPLLQSALRKRSLSARVRTADEALDRLQDWSADRGRRFVLFLNEFDGLLEHHPDFIQRLRARHEAGQMRFVFVGYAVARWSLDETESPLYHFTSAGSGRAFHLGPLDPREARKLLRWLTEPPLSFQWAPGHEHRCEELLMEHSYGVASVLQTLCQALVEQLVQQGAALIEVNHVRELLDSRPALIDALDRFDLAAATGRKGKDGENLAREAARLVILLLAWRLYFTGERRRRQGPPRTTAPAKVAFSTDELVPLCEEGVFALPLTALERRRLMDWMKEMPHERFLQALSLSLILAPLDAKGPPRWWFQSHIYPSELALSEAQGTSVVDRVLDQAQRVLQAFENQLDAGGGA